MIGFSMNEKLDDVVENSAKKQYGDKTKGSIVVDTIRDQI